MPVQDESQFSGFTAEDTENLAADELGFSPIQEKLLIGVHPCVSAVKLSSSSASSVVSSKARARMRAPMTINAERVVVIP
jgi:hypothetical protein